MTHGRSASAFSLLETIGVLALLVIIGALVLPRVFQSGSVSGSVQGVNKARLNEVSMAVGAVKTAVAQHRARFGSLACSNGVALPVRGTFERFDAILLAEQLLERPFTVRIGKGCTLRLVNVSHPAAGDTWAGTYDLAGRGTTTIPGASYVVEAVIAGLTLDEAKALNDELDGPALGANAGQDDRNGRVVYRLDSRGTPGEVRIYIAHQ